MSAASRVILSLVLASLGAAASLLPWATDKETTATLALRQQDVMVPTAASAVRLVQGPPTEPSAILPEPTTLITDRHPVRRPITLNQPAKPRGREAVARELQRELRRVGCYAGQLHGLWTASTRWAMRAFNDRVNAVLPTDEPDGVLLALVQAQPAKVCGTPCPTGQGLSSSGRCVPDAILAHRGGSKVASMLREPSASTPSAWTMTTTAGGPPPTRADQDHPDGAAVVGQGPRAVTHPAEARAPRRAAEGRRHRPVSRDRSWAYNLLRQRGGFTFN